MLKSLCIKLFTVVSLSMLVLTGCASDRNSSSYVSSSTVGKVLEGTVLSSRPVTINESDNLQGNTAGLIGGGILGGIGGSAIGKGKGNYAATAGAAVAGAALGSLAQKYLGKSDGMEYVVRLDPKYVKKSASSTVTKSHLSYGNKSVQEQLNESMDLTDTQTDLISVVQGKDVIFQPGQRVLIIYSDDRPRLAPLQY